MTTLLRRRFLTLLVLSFVLSQIGLTSVMGIIISNRTDTAFEAQHLALFEGCLRLNIERKKTNLGNYADYLVDGVVLERSHPPANAAPQVKAFERQFIPKLSYAVHSKAWTPPTDCSKAVNRRGVSYQSPQSIPFYKKLPPRSALK